MSVILVGILLGVNTFIALTFPNPITIACVIVTGCMFLINLSGVFKGRR